MLAPMTDASREQQLPLFPAAGGETAPGVVPMAAGAAFAPDHDMPASWPRPGDTLAAAVAAFDDHLARLGKTANTRRAFASDLRLALSFLGEGRAVDAVTTEALERFLTWLLSYRGQPCSPKSYARRVTTLKVFFAWLAEVGAVAEDPARRVVHRRAEAPLPAVLSDTEVSDLLTEAYARARARPPDPRPALLVRLLLDAGLKKGELTRLLAADVAADAAPPSLLVRYDHPRWREKERRVPLSPHVLPLLEAYRTHYRPTGRLFDCTDRNLEYVLTDLAKAARLPEQTHFETLRWTSALRAWRAGVAPDALRADLGLSPITWADTQRKLELLDDGAAGAKGVARYFEVPGS